MIARHLPRRLSLWVLVALLLLLRCLPGRAAHQSALAGQTDLDAFMARVLDRRAENWKTLHDYILSEAERFTVTGPARVVLYGLRREYDWYVRDGFLIRSPIRYDGVTISEPDRRKYEADWLREEREREAKRDTPQAENAPEGEPGAVDAGIVADATPTVEGLVGQRIEPRFVSEAYFLKFKFEPGNYYLVGREKFEGREVVRVEYYPRRLFAGEDASEKRDPEEPESAGARSKERGRERAEEERIERSFDKVALITLWIDPGEFQIVRYTFDNVDFGFLPGRWIVRVDDVRASMTMGRVFDGTWLPKEISMRAGLTFASGSYAFEYGREFSNHRKAEISATIRSVGKP